MADDVAAMTKVATQKTAGVLGDDLALNAQQVTGVSADRELPVVWAVAKARWSTRRFGAGGAGHQCVCAHAHHALADAGRCLPCFEGVEKLAHKFLQ